jgi:hypothetical protein
MRRKITPFAILVFSILYTDAAIGDDAKSSAVLAVMAEGIGDLTLASPEWVEAAQKALIEAVAGHEAELKDLGPFTMCVVAHNPPAFLHVESPLAWHAKFDGADVVVSEGELPADECDYKVEGDHSIMSILGHIQYHGNDPEVVSAAQTRLRKVSRWEIHGEMPDNKVLKSVFRSFRDTMAVRTMPRFVWMSPEWVSVARHIVSSRARMDEFSDGIQDVEFTFSEVFTDAPRYAFPDGGDSGFWVHCSLGEVDVGAGPLPDRLGTPDYLNQLLYTPTVPVGRTVNALMTDADKVEAAAYSKVAFGVDTGERNLPVVQSTPEQKGKFPPGLGAIMSVLHDELSYRTSGELPSDYDDSVRTEWASPQMFDRPDGYDPSWVLYDQVDIYGDPLE